MNQFRRTECNTSKTPESLRKRGDDMQGKKYKPTPRDLGHEITAHKTTDGGFAQKK